MSTKRTHRACATARGKRIAATVGLCLLLATAANVDAVQRAGQANDAPAWRSLPGFPKALSNVCGSSPLVRDIDDDGELEIVFGDNSGYMHVLNARGQEEPGWPRVVRAWIQSDPAFGDIDGDGVGEIVVGTGLISGGQIWAWDVSGATVPGFPVLAGGLEADVNLNEGVTLEDVDGDGACEIFIKGQADGHDYYVALDGTGNFLPGWPIVMPGAALFSGCKPLVADITGDGEKEIVALNSDGRLFAFDRGGTILSGWPRYVGRGHYIDPLAVDLDADGVCDVVAGAFAFRGDGTSLPGWPLPSPRLGSYSSAIAADLTGDGTPEIILPNQQGQSLAVVRCDGTFLEGWPIQTLSQPSADTTALVADVDGDMDNEIVIALTYPAQLAAYELDGTLVPGWPYFIMEHEYQASTPTIADIDLDGNWDIAFGTYDNQFQVASLDIPMTTTGQDTWTECGGDQWRRSVYTQGASIPDPVLVFTGTEDYEAQGQQWTRYCLSVSNRHAYPAWLFAPAPDLPPCGLNPYASRTWVRVFADDGTYLYGFCALSQPDDLDDLWFAVPQGSAAPAAVYITLEDRRSGVAYISNLVTLDASESDAGLPAPDLVFVGTEDYEANGYQWTRYLLSVSNRDKYPAELFDPAPDLPPCGLNPNASRTWVRIFEADGTYLYGFCALSQPDDLDDLWFALPRGSTPPSAVCITLEDRVSGITYTSNLVSVDTTEADGSLPAPQLVFLGTEQYDNDGYRGTRYLLSVTNRSEYPVELFAPAPDLPPCGLNTNASRTWVEIYEAGGRRLYGFCALSDPEHMDGLWFGVPEGTVPPSAVYITLEDRLLGLTYTSNTVSLELDR